MKKYTQDAKSKQPLDDLLVSRLFARLAAKYGQKWSSLYPTTPALQIAKSEWAKELSCVSDSLIGYGLDKCLEKHPSWPPTIGEFKALCRINPSDLGLPDEGLAWSEVCREGGKYSHGVVLAARNDSRCDVFNWRLLPVEKGLRLFTPIYQIYIDRVMNGEVFDLPIMLEDKAGKAVTPEEQKKAAKPFLFEIKSMLKKGATL